ncbi:MAG: Na-translocating system protein MpsC family protein [Planctomycetota bacterium]|jgi:uncharacterized protein YbcI
MDSEEKLKQQVTEVAKRFFVEHMSMNPESIVVDIHSDCLVLTLHNAISRAETAYTKEKLSSNLLDRFYKDTFDASKLIFETAVGKVFPQRITGSFMSLHPEFGKCVIVVSLCSDNAKKTQSK